MNKVRSEVQAVRTARTLIAEGDRLGAIRYLRSLGMPFSVAQTMVKEIGENAPWYRRY